jgi:GNAT superfamily N-acetyltransferase
LTRGSDRPPLRAEEPRFVVEPLDPKRHDRASFSCGVEPLDRYLKQQASQDRVRGIAAVFVLRERATGAVAGFFTLSQASIQRPTLPDALAKKLPKLGEIPATLLGRLAVDERFRGAGIGKALLIAALRRACAASAEAASWAVVVDAKDDDAERFYRHFDFAPLVDAAKERRLFLPMASVQALLKREGLA